MSPSPFLLPSARGSVLPAAPAREASWATSTSSDSSSANTADENTPTHQLPASTAATPTSSGRGGTQHAFSLPQQPPLPSHHLHHQQQQQQHYQQQQPVQQPPQPRTIVCEGKLSVLLNMPGGGGSASAAAAKEDWKMRRRSLDVLKMAFAGVLGGGGSSSSSGGGGSTSGGGGGGGGGSAMLGTTSGTDTQGRSLAKDKWRNVRGWLDDAALLHLEGCTFPAAIPPPSVSISLGPRASSSSGSTGSGTDSRPPPTTLGGRGAGAGRPRIKWRFSQDYAARKSTDSGGGTNGVGGGGQLGGYSRKSLDVWDRRSWSIDGDASNRTDTNIPFSPSQTSLFFTAAAPTRPTMLTTFRVLACSAPDPSQTFLVLHVEPYTAHPLPSSSSSSTLLTSKALEAASGSSTETLISTLYIRFTSAAKLERWRAALTLSLCVAQARAEVDVARSARARYEAAEQARLDAEREKEAVERTARKEKKAFEKKVREMFSAEEVQDVYQETADDLAAAEKRITALEATLAAERAAKQLAVDSLAQYRQETELPVGEHNALLLRHEELCRRYADLRRDAMLVKALYDKEKTAHGRLARLLRRQAEDGAAVAVAADDGGGRGGGGLLAAPNTDEFVLSPPPSPALDALALVRTNDNDDVSPPSASLSSLPSSSLLPTDEQQQQQQLSPTLRAAHQLLPAEIERRVSVDWQRY